MAVKSIRSIILSIFIAIMCFSFLPPADAHALLESSNSTSLPPLDRFIQEVKNGQADELRGIYIVDLLAARIVQQPSGSNEFISPWENVVTQFSLASRLGSTGLIAHSYLAGKSFVLLQPGQEINLVYGDGHTSKFVVAESLRYQALNANSTSSTFMNLNNKRIHTANQLFTEIYNRPGTVIFQTCIEANNNPTWGRLFVIAEPAAE